MVNREAEMFHKQGMAYLREGKNKEALELFDKALKFDDEYFPALNNKGVILLEFKEYKRAAECFEKVVRLNPADRMALYNRGYALSMMGDYEGSFKIFDFFLMNTSKDNDFFKFALFLQAQNYYGLKDYENALVLLNDVIKIDNNFKEAHELRSEVNKIINKK